MLVACGRKLELIDSLGFGQFEKSAWTRDGHFSQSADILQVGKIRKRIYNENN